MANFPLNFHVNSKASSGISTTFIAKENHCPDITCAIPTEFNGPGNAYSPEGLFGLSIITCMTAMFKVICEKNGVTFSSLDIDANMTMDFAPQESLLMITEIDIIIKLTGVSDKEKAKVFMEKAIKDCPISHSVKCGKTFKIEIN